LSRREALKAPLLLALTAGASVAARSTNAQELGANSRTLVAYFTRTGNTRVIAGQIRRAFVADMFEIEPAEAYPEDYQATVDQAQSELERGYEPPLKATVPNIGSYEAVFLGFPIWGMTVPSSIRSFLSRHDLSGRTIVPFITHGGYGLGQSLSVLAKHAPRSRILDGFSKQCDQERETLQLVTAWLGTVRTGG
jgi:flavodoxin